MTRIVYVDPTTAAPAVRESLQALPDLKLFHVVAHAETAFRPWLELGGALLGSLQLSPVLRELAVLAVADSTGSTYEWAQHESIATSVGVRPEQVRALGAGATGMAANGANFDDTERLVVDVAREAARTGSAGEAQVRALAGSLGERQVVELLLVVGYYVGIALLTRTLDLEPDAPPRLGVVDAAVQRQVPA